jgi:hypothetical protein
VCTAGHEGVHTAGTHVHEHRPRVAVILDVRHIQCSHESPHKEPGTQRGPLTQPPLKPCLTISCPLFLGTNNPCEFSLWCNTWHWGGWGEPRSKLEWAGG